MWMGRKDRSYLKAGGLVVSVVGGVPMVSDHVFIVEKAYTQQSILHQRKRYTPLQKDSWPPMLEISKIWMKLVTDYIAKSRECKLGVLDEI